MLPGWGPGLLISAKKGRVLLTFETVLGFIVSDKVKLFLGMLETVGFCLPFVPLKSLTTEAFVFLCNSNTFWQVLQKALGK